MANDKRGAESLIGLFSDGNNVLCEKIVHADGTFDYIELDVEDDLKSITDRFKGTDTVPNDWAPDDDDTHGPQSWEKGSESTLEQISDLLTRDQHLERSVSLELLLVKIFALGEVNTKGNMQFKGILVEMCKIAGGHWLENIKDIK
jgi:hypothetical protein